MQTETANLSADERTLLKRWIERDGEETVARAASTARGTVIRALAGLDLRRGSLMLIRQAMKRAGVKR